MIPKFKKLLLFSLIIFSQNKLNSMFSNFNKLKTLSKTKFILQPKNNFNNLRQFSETNRKTLKNIFDKNELREIENIYRYEIYEYIRSKSGIDQNFICGANDPIKKTGEALLLSDLNVIFQIKKKLIELEDKQSKGLAEIKSLLKEFMSKNTEKIQKTDKNQIILSTKGNQTIRLAYCADCKNFGCICGSGL